MRLHRCLYVFFSIAHVNYAELGRTLANSDQEPKRFIITYKEGHAPLLPLSDTLGGSSENNFVIGELLPETAARMNESDEIYVEEDVLYRLIQPINPEGDPEEKLSIFSNSSSEQNSRLNLRSTEGNPYGIAMVRAPQVSRAWMYGPRTKKICIIDTGYNYDHGDLPEAGVSGYTGYLNNHIDWKQDGHGHGTHVAGIIGALNNDKGVVGVAPHVNLPLHIVRLFDDGADYVWASDVISAVQECVNAGSNVVNMSLGRNGEPMQSEINAYRKFLYDDNVLVVSASGNSGASSNAKFYPAAYENVISVASVAENSLRDSFSTHNDQVNLAAPGSHILSTFKNGGYSRLSGTSMSAPHVSGVAALVWSHFRSKPAIEIKRALFDSATDLGPPGRDNYYGHGLLNAKEAYTLLQNNYKNAHLFKFKAAGKIRDCRWLQMKAIRLQKTFDIYESMDRLDRICKLANGFKKQIIYRRCKKTCFIL